MITFTESDYKLPEIKEESKLFNLVTKNKFHVYGLRQENNPPILIEYDGNIASAEFSQRLNVIVEFFKQHGIDVDTSNEADDYRVDIGLRKDLRAKLNKNKKPLLAASIVSTIVYCLEGRIELEQLKNYRLPTLPKFSTNFQVTVPPRLTNP